MARIKNDMFKFSGAFGEFSFSQDEFGTIVKQKPTGSKKDIKKSPRSEGTRQGNMEMGGASMAAKSLRLAFTVKKLGLGDRYFCGRLNGKMRKLVMKGDGLLGQRKVDIRKNGAVLEGFEFINARPLVYSIGGIKEGPTLSNNRSEVNWTSPTLNRKQQITAPKEATHFTFNLGAATVSNYQYNSSLKKYLPVEGKFKNLSAFKASNPIDLKQKTIAAETLRVSLSETSGIPDEVAVVVVVGISFFRNVNGEMLEVKDAGGMKILGVC